MLALRAHIIKLEGKGMGEKMAVNGWLSLERGQEYRLPSPRGAVLLTSIWPVFRSTRSALRVQGRAQLHWQEFSVQVESCAVSERMGGWL